MCACSQDRIYSQPHHNVQPHHSKLYSQQPCSSMIGSAREFPVYIERPRKNASFTRHNSISGYVSYKNTEYVTAPDLCRTESTKTKRVGWKEDRRDFVDASSPSEDQDFVASPSQQRATASRGSSYKSFVVETRASANTQNFMETPAFPDDQDFRNIQNSTDIRGSLDTRGSTDTSTSSTTSTVALGQARFPPQHFDQKDQKSNLKKNSGTQVSVTDQR